MNNQGYAVVFQGKKTIHDSRDSWRLPEKRKLTKAEFVLEWNKRDEAGRQELMRTTVPVT